MGFNLWRNMSDADFNERAFSGTGGGTAFFCRAEVSQGPFFAGLQEEKAGRESAFHPPFEPEATTASGSSG